MPTIHRPSRFPPVALPARRRAPIPAEPGRALLQAGGERPARPGQAAFGNSRRLVEQAQRDRVHVQRDRQLVHGGLQREAARRLARRAHPGRRREVQPDDAVRGHAARRGVHHPAHQPRLLDELVMAGSLQGVVMADHQQPPVAVRAETQALPGAGAMAVAGEHLLPGQRDLAGPARRLGADGGERRRADRRPLVAVMHREPPIRPFGHRGVRLHGVMVLVGGFIGGIDLHRGGCESLGEVALRGVRRGAAVDHVGLVGRRLRRLEIERRRGAVHLNRDQAGGVPRGFMGFGDDKGDELAVEHDAVDGQHGLRPHDL